jgi:polyadenylate-binding protein
MIKHLPPHYTDIQLYDLFRPFGTLASVRTSTGYGPGTSIVEFCFEDEAAIAEEAMHCSDVEGQTISVQLFQPRRASGQHREFSPDAPAFIPSGMIHPGFSPQRMPVAQPYQPAPFVHGPGQQVQLAPLIGPGASHSGLIDPCNLFIKV